MATNKVNDRYHAHISEAALEAKRAYNREWRRKNKDKIKAAQLRYWEKKAAEKAAEAK